jgi:hypothetical protein
MEVPVSALLRDLLGALVSQQQYESWGGSIGEVQSPNFQGENPRSDLNWLCLAIALLKALF